MQGGTVRESEVSQLGQAVVLSFCPASYTYQMTYVLFPLSFRRKIRIKMSADDFSIWVCRIYTNAKSLSLENVVTLTQLVIPLMFHGYMRTTVVVYKDKWSLDR